MKMDANAFLAKRQAYRNSMERLDKLISVENDKAEHYANEAKRISYNLDNVESIIDELVDEFRNNTKLNKTDMQFLFLAIGLQCVRWMFQPKVNMKFEKVSRENRSDAKVDGDKYDFAQAEEKAKSYDNVKKSRKYPNKKEILLYSVPYDVMKGTEHVVVPGVTDAGKRLSPGNHHAATFGHDPVVGYIIGTMNILTRTVTYKKPTLETEIVSIPRTCTTNKDTYVNKGNIGPHGLIQRTIETSREDITRIPAAVCKQLYHMQSDKYTKQGLPIPFIPADKAQELLKDGWNSNELERLSKHLVKNVATVGVQATLSLLINTIIDALYRLVDDGASLEIKEVKARKIIMYSNTIASTSNVIYTAITKNINNLDFGGMLITLYRIATDTKMINEIRREYVFGGFEKNLTLREFNLLEDVEWEV